MTTFAKLKNIADPAHVDCIHNRDMGRHVTDNRLFIVMSDEVHRKYNISVQFDEVLLYSPTFEPELSCMWIAHKPDFEYLEY